MTVRLLDFARFRLCRDGPEMCDAGVVFDSIKDAGEALDARKIEIATACAYALFAIREERDAQGLTYWPRTKRDARAALAVASSMAESYEAGSVTNVLV